MIVCAYELDSDMVLTRDFRPAWGAVACDVCVVAEESGALRVTPAHRPLLVRWGELLAHPEHRKAQAMPMAERPLHRKGDQDVLAALLGSTTFATVPVRALRPPRDILHTGWGRLAHTLALGSPSLRDLPATLAVAFRVWRAGPRR